MIAVFKTNVRHRDDAEHVKNILLNLYKDAKINFDLDDSDKVLRIEGPEFKNEHVLSKLELLGFQCEELE